MSDEMGIYCKRLTKEEEKEIFKLRGYYDRPEMQVPMLLDKVADIKEQSYKQGKADGVAEEKARLAGICGKDWCMGKKLCKVSEKKDCHDCLQEEIHKLISEVIK